MSEKEYWIGLDVGSTTVKAAVIDPITQCLVFSRYTRHGAEQVSHVRSLLASIHQNYPNRPLRLAICGSGGKAIADALGVLFVQEVVAGSIAVQHLYPQTRTVIELGGQDAKIVFFHHDEATGKLLASDMRMNGACAGGTGAFIDEVASILHIPVEETHAHATRGSHVFDISGRCGVFAKTDIQPLINQGVSKDDIALSTFHAIAKQTIGGLAQGLEIHPPVMFLGGPLSFNPSLVGVFAKRLGLSPEQAIVPPEPETMIAYGAALALGTLGKTLNEPLNFGQVGPVLDRYQETQKIQGSATEKSFFASPGEKKEFQQRHNTTKGEIYQPAPGPIKIYLGIDGGSTTSKCVALDEQARVIGTWYAHNKGSPLDTTKKLLLSVESDLVSRGLAPEVVGMGTTGYAEHLFASAFKADYHTVETVSHATAAQHFVPDASFILDIGGQDMKALFINQDIVTGIVLNEACSAGCGSFLENFAQNLNIPVGEIAEKAFDSTSPCTLGSRCTVFMNSSIITEQKNGKTPADIMAGLCRSIIENVFTKVIRVPNFSHLGSKIVVQGGTFKNEAVLRAMEQFTGISVIRAPFPGEMGALGIALLTRDHQKEKSRFIGFEALKNFTYTQKNGVVCELCSNSCRRTVVSFTDGSAFVSGNRCERGEIVGSDSGKESPGKTRKSIQLKGLDLMKERNKLLLSVPAPLLVNPPQELRIGIPLVLEFWNSFPFWKTLFETLGFRVISSGLSTQRQFQSGLRNVPSDTVCFPAKLVHGHISTLLEVGVDRIFMPMINRMPPEFPGTKGNQVCAVVKGYPLVIKYSDNPERSRGVAFDHPMFHWFSPEDKDRQITEYLQSTYKLDPSLIKKALEIAQTAQETYKTSLSEKGEALLAQVRENNSFAVVLGGRPYHGDPLVNHDLSSFFTSQGIPVLPLEALPGLESMDLSPTRAEITNNFHARMLAAALYVARRPELELVQIVSFGCGHDAIISDEIISIMQGISGKAPLVLKMDESDVKGPLNIRIRSFLETVKARRKHPPQTPKQLPEPFPLKFTKEDVKTKTILIPNVSEAFSAVVRSAMASEGYLVEVMPLADKAAIALGKQYVHNDMCYPAQVNIGEMLGALKSGKYDLSKIACGLAKSECDCRLAHYGSLARKALDEAGYPEIPLITTDTVDRKDIHPGFKLGLTFQIRAMWGLNMVDVLEHLRRRIRPYELVKGQTEECFQDAVARIAKALVKSVRGALKEFDAALAIFAAIPVDMSVRKPRVFVIGEFLLNFHSESNQQLESYLEANGMEVILPDMFMPVHRDFIKMDSEIKLFFVKYPLMEAFANDVTLYLIDRVQKTMIKKVRSVPFFEPSAPIRELAKLVDPVVHHTFTPGEGWLIAAEILHHADKGVDSFIIVQPFGCLPNHIVGRGLMKTMKERFPKIQILSLDFDPDTSFANIENRLQMLIINAREMEESRK
ncbi:MAG: activase [Spirochaetes bacterium GWB1_48_6]|nr:MAG: activase [Spirochaetes bacterium GWB1_48_6]